MRVVGRLLSVSVIGCFAACGSTAVDPPPAPVVPPATIEQDAGIVEQPPIDAGRPPAPPPRDASVPDVSAGALKRVFASSTTMSGNLGGLAAADARCATLAAEAGLAGTFVAWLSAENGPHAEDRVTGNGPWYMGSGDLVANEKAELSSGVLHHAIDRDERGLRVTGFAWTGTGASGRYSTNDCDKWRTGSLGRVGDVTASNTDWTSAGADSCSELRRLYCFQQ